jgi:hypothetical protein
MVEWVPAWRPTGYHPLSRKWVEAVCDADNAEEETRANTILIRVSNLLRKDEN